MILTASALRLNSLLKASREVVLSSDNGAWPSGAWRRANQNRKASARLTAAITTMTAVFRLTRFALREHVSKEAR